MDWFVPCNVRHYDVFKAFSDLRRVNWGQPVRQVKAGDTAYIYVSEPYSAITHKCRVVRADLEPEEALIDDSKYSLTQESETPYTRYMELEAVGEYADPGLALCILKNKGLTQIRSIHGISPRLSAYLEEVTDHYAGEADAEEDALLLQTVNRAPARPVKPFAYQGKPRAKLSPTVRNGQRVFARDRQTSLNALSHANYLCEIDPGHPTFTRKNWDKPYTEPHHLVPMSYSDQFDVSLDVEENIVSLCSNCHNQLHYGKEFDRMLEKLYQAREQHLKRVGICISWDKLLSMYR